MQLRAEVVVNVMNWVLLVLFFFSNCGIHMRFPYFFPFSRLGVLRQGQYLDFLGELI